MFNYDWWHGPARQHLADCARLRCLKHRFPEADSLDLPNDGDPGHFLSELEVHTIVYLRDGFSYEIGALVESDVKSYLTCEVVPVEESWQTGGFVVSVPFDDIARVEIFAIHPSEKPRETPHITGFRATSEGFQRD
ncbi:MAG: hypothetical protein JXQ73_04950 [Phycisphaerae bacterium]|nr:hypothetical protein [Phycisphaerae bacterium]